MILTIQSGVPVARIELLDEAQIDAINKYSKLDHNVAPTLFFEFHGSPAGVAEQAETVKAIAAEHGGDDFRWATTPEERSKLWQARHDAYYAALALRPGSKGWPTDVCVPISRLAECIRETKHDLAQSSIPSALAGHVGDGNFHLIFMIDPNRPKKSPRPVGSTTAWSPARWRWKAPAPASTASDTARWTFWLPNTARR